MATGARGEGLLEVGDDTYAVLYTNRALAQAERVTGKSILELFGQIQANALSIGDVAQLLTIGMEHARREARAGGKSYTVNDAWGVLDRVGFRKALEVVVDAVVAVLSYGGDEQGDEPHPPE